MNLGLLDITNRNTRKINKWVLKLIGLAKSDITPEELLELLSHHVQPSDIQALVYDSFNRFYTLFLNNIESFCQLVDNVFPTTTNDDLCNFFENFGPVFEVTNYHILPNSSKFSHILSGKREISFILPGSQTELPIPVNVFCHPYRYHVTKLCSACMTEGHSVLTCPDRDDDVKSESSEEASSDSEISSVLKNESISAEVKEKTAQIVEFKEEVIKDDETYDPRDNGSAICRIEKKSIHGSSDSEYPMPTLISSDFSVEPSEELPLLPGDGVSDVVFSSAPLPITYDRTLPVSEEGISKSSFASSTSNFLNKLLVNRNERKDLMLQNENSVGTVLAIESSNITKQNDPYPAGTSDCNNGLTIPTGENLSLTSNVTKPRKLSWHLTSEEEKCIDSSVGVLPPRIVREILLSDFRNLNSILDMIYHHTPHLRKVNKQFRNLYQIVKQDIKIDKRMLSRIVRVLRSLKRAAEPDFENPF